MNEFEALAQVKSIFGSWNHDISCHGPYSTWFRYSIYIDGDHYRDWLGRCIIGYGNSWEAAINDAHKQVAIGYIKEDYDKEFPEEWEPNDYY
jgi:hypothetical protein